MNKTILITGASSGIGKATALLFQAKGWNVIATMRQPKTATELQTLDRVLVTRLDVLDLASIEQAVQEGLNRFGKIDVLLNNAGYGAYGVLESFSRERILRQFNTNVIGLLDVTRTLLPHFRAQQSGTIINISSIGGKMTFPLGTLYHGTKFAVEGLSESLSYELEAIGCRVKIVEPGAIATDFTGRSFDFSNDESLAEYQSMIGTVMAGMPRLFDQALPAEVVADVIYGAATDGSDRLRYTAGDDAHAIIANRQASDDAAFIAAMKTQFGI